MASGELEDGARGGCWGLALEAMALSRARLTKARARDAAVGGGPVAGCPELEAGSEGGGSLAVAVACRHTCTSSDKLLQHLPYLFILSCWNHRGQGSTFTQVWMDGLRR